MSNNNFSSSNNSFNLNKPASSESAVNPFKAEGKRWLEVAKESVLGTPTPKESPEEIAKKQQDEENRRNNIMKFFQEMAANEQSSIRHQKYMEEQTKQKEIEESQQVRQFDVQKQEQKRNEDVFRAQRRIEVKAKGG